MGKKSKPAGESEVALDYHRNPIKPGFYFEVEEVMPQRGIHYFDRVSNRKDKWQQEEPVWIVYSDGMRGRVQQLISFADTHGYAPATREDVEARIANLRERANWLEGKSDG